MSQKHAVETAELSAQAPADAYRTGPIGLLVRAGLLALMVLSLVSLIDQGGIVTFRRPSVAGEPSVWFLTFVMAVLFVSLVGQLGGMLTRRPATRWQLGAIAVLVGSTLVAAVIGQLSAGAVWGFPLADLVWAFDVVMLIETTVALAIAIVLGTPGCEIGVWGELMGRRRPDPAQPPMVACVVGLHLLDDFERRRQGGPPPDHDRPGRHQQHA